jgi:PAS domain S-box-containing protein
MQWEQQFLVLPRPEFVSKTQETGASRDKSHRRLFQKWHGNGFFARMSLAAKNDGANIGKYATGMPPVGEPSQNRARRHLAGSVLWGAGLLLAILSLASVITLSHRSGEQLKEATHAVTHTREVLEKLGDISAKLSEVESAARSFVISGKQSHLDPFYTAAKAVPPQLDELKQLLQSDPERLRSIDEIDPVIARHLKAMKDLVELGKQSLFRSAGQRGLTDAGNTLMEQIRTTFSALVKGQRARLDEEEKAVAERAARVALISVVGSLLAGVVVLGGGACVLRARHGRLKAEEKLGRLLGSMPDAVVMVNAEGRIVSANAQAEKLFGYSDRELQGESMALLVPERMRQTQRQYYAACFTQRGGGVPERALELCGLHKDGREFPIEVSTKPLVAENGSVVTSAIRDITARKEVEQQISKLNHELEVRALELEAANQELEAFSYSVSHDLRSPLQNIDSFCQILMEDYANRLDADGRDYVQRLRGSCRHMEEIIDALLALSNMMRSELHVMPFDLSALAKAVAADLKLKNPDRLLDWVIAEGLIVEGDSQLLRVALENLFGNAWKFTANRPSARIEFGALPQSDGSRTYFVRDDGAGFDMARANQLFTPFKRLHDQSEFRGTGIGLATVQRVIQRHRGKIWAEGVVNHGATFCFTLADGAGAANLKDHELAKPK